MAFRQVIPNSNVNSVNEQYEYYLVWWSPTAGIRSWLFSHTDGVKRDDFRGTVVETIDDIRSVPVMEQQRISIVTTGLDSETYDYVKSIFSSNRIYQVSKDLVKRGVSIDRANTRRPNKLKEFTVSLDFYYKEENVLNV